MLHFCYNPDTALLSAFFMMWCVPPCVRRVGVCAGCYVGMLSAAGVRSLYGCRGAIVFFGHVHYVCRH